MRTAIETVRGLYYKLHMMGVHISGPMYIYGDNMSVIYDTHSLESTLKKMSNSIAYHTFFESLAMNKIRTVHVRIHDNIADLSIKFHGVGQKGDHLVSRGIYDIAD